MFRWWTGSEWTPAVTYDPQSTPPPATGAGPTGFDQVSGNYGPTGSGLGQAASGQFGYGTPTTTGYQARRGGAARWWLIGGVLVVVAVLVIVFAVPGIQRVIGNAGGAGSNYSPDICPPASDNASSTPAAPQAGWIGSADLAYPAMGGEWTTTYDNRVPWGSTAMEEQIIVQQNYNGQGNSWVASVLVSDLYVGDGFASTKDAANTVFKCILGIYYSDTEVTQKAIESEKHNVDGKSGWLLETQLSFDVPGLETKGERVLLVVVQTGAEGYGLFYASIPDTRSDLMPQVRKAMSKLKVS